MSGTLRGRSFLGMRADTSNKRPGLMESSTGGRCALPVDCLTHRSPIAGYESRPDAVHVFLDSYVAAP